MILGEGASSKQPDIVEVYSICLFQTSFSLSTQIVGFPMRQFIWEFSILLQLNLKTFDHVVRLFLPNHLVVIPYQ